MKLKKLWIPALLLTIVGGAVKLCDTFFNVNGDGFFLSTDVCNGIFTGAFLLLFVIGYILSIADRKKRFNAQVQKDFLCGVFGFIASVMIIATGVVTMLALDSSKIAECILAIAGGGILLYESCISFTGQNGMKRIPVAGLLLPVWGCMRFISMFSVYTQTSLHATELFDFVALAFLVMFLFYQSMFFAGVNNSNAVRKSAVYGTVYIMLSLVVCIDLFIKMFSPVQAPANIDTQTVTPSLINIMTYVGDLAMCLYAFFFVKDVLKAAQNTLTDKDDDDENDAPLMAAGDKKSEPVKTEESVETFRPAEEPKTPEVPQEPEIAAKPMTFEEVSKMELSEPVSDIGAASVDTPPVKAEPTVKPEQPAPKKPAKTEAPAPKKSATAEIPAPKKPVKTETSAPKPTAPKKPASAPVEAGQNGEDTYAELMQMLDDLTDN